MATTSLVYSLLFFINGAFGNLPFHAIEQALDETDAKGQISNWIMFMVSNRFITLSLAGTSITRFIPKGCPQGGVLSPFLWNLVLNDLLQQFNFTNTIQAFADDLCLLTQGSDISTIWDITEAEIKRINHWCKQKGLEFSEIKIQMVLWTKNKTLKHPKHITINKVKIEIKNSAKYLGITIDKNLNWIAHVDKTVKHCMKAILPRKKQ